MNVLKEMAFLAILKSATNFTCATMVIDSKIKNVPNLFCFLKKQNSVNIPPRLSVQTNQNIAKTEFILFREYAMLFINAQTEFGGINNTVPMAFFSIQK